MMSATKIRHESIFMQCSIFLYISENTLRLCTKNAYPNTPPFFVKHTLPVFFNFGFNISWRWAGHVARMGEERGVYRVLAGKPEGRRPLGRPRRRWVDNIRMDLQEVGRGYMDWIGLAQDRDSWRTLVSVVMNLRVP